MSNLLNRLRRIINYSTSGLGNRLRPLASCYSLAKKSDRKLAAFWDVKTLNGCQAPFHSLFKNDLEILSEDDLKSLEDVVVFSEDGPGHCAEREHKKFGRDVLLKIGKEHGLRSIHDISPDYSQSNIVFYGNNFANNSSPEDSASFIKSLVPCDDILSNINSVRDKLGLSKEVVGIHARGTDFGSNLGSYVNAIHSFISQNPSCKLFLSTEDREFEDQLHDQFGDKILIHRKNFYPEKIDKSKPWPDNFNISEDHAKEAVVDLYLLASTYIMIYDPRSTFCEIARILQ
jgi:hypothetical protein